MPKTYRFLIMTTDPVHVGTGGMRLGRVDNTIVREPGTKLPKIPGTALHGAIRAYAARRYGKPQCAGQGSKEGRRHCGQPTCPICYTFGSIQGEARSFSGVVTITDARILLFPVYSMVGPVWVTSPDALRDAGFNGDYSVSDDKAKWSGLTDGNFLNLGWLMLEKEGSWPPPDDLKNKLPEPVKNRIVLVSPTLFSQIVNSNLEVRTSVAINPETGAAEEGALFTYEAIPRATFLWFDVVVDDFRNAFPSKVLWK
ncbi:MAG: type III-B CRISPR module RAMP protein Cmr4, partial [Candidatus Hydrothermota bacterium]